MMTALEMRYYIGMVLVGLVQGDHQEGDVNSQVEEMYRRVREEYDRHRAYYYELVERFRDECFGILSYPRINSTFLRPYLRHSPDLLLYYEYEFSICFSRNNQK